MINILEYVDIKGYSTLNTGGHFRYFTIILSLDDLTSAYSIAQSDRRFKDIPIFILGNGSNIVFSDGVVNVLVLKNEIKGFEVIREDDISVDIKVGAGEIWDSIVKKTVHMGLSGLEAMSFIPGTVGAGPIQNVGAYGKEVKDVILEVEAFDREKGTVVKLLNEDCKFDYRESIFKGEAKGRYIITFVTYRLFKKVPSVPNYPDVLKYFEDMEIENPTLVQIRDAIIFIRKCKLPNPKEIPNVGSFFKNPIVLNNVAEKIREEFPNAKFFLVGDAHTKVPAGWLIENAGLKGVSFGKVSVYEKNALVLVNNGGGSYEDVISARDYIIKIVKERFGIVLEQEPEII